MPRARAPGRDAIRRAADVLRAGGVVAFPTETVYGLGADASQADAVARVFAMKGRPATHPVIVHVSSAAEAARWAAAFPPLAKRLARAFWPGPLTLILRSNGRACPETTGGLPTVGLRVPSHPVARALLREFGGGVAAPSANRYGSVSPTTAAHVRDDLGAEPDVVLDGGPCDVGVESTIVDLTSDEPAILRHGGVPQEDIERVAGRPVPFRRPGRVRASGTHARHYAPRHARLVTATAGEAARVAADALRDGRSVRVLAPRRPRGLARQAEFVAVPAAPRAFARRLYRLLREADDARVGVLVVVAPPDSGLGAAVADRLRRAAAGSRGRRRG